ncbi:hypothetical protein SAMN02745121_03373 [Nannocystis exedens]|uniref:Lipoprotein n=1 Tax=Nannocystis exedens TaxID=54 RepID=A0A1I1YLV1_9BACT|nr:hypothetical protein [Nannocystis exedens]PCC70298.1 hypothetical protein NAEX_03341 [Nannocystis exedens]SFE20282.1 hypothetical protein SAMN02745121_03373 [Nannocystis exedens]
MSTSRSLLALPVLLGFACGGNVVDSDRATLAVMAVPATAGVAVTDVELKVVELRRDDGSTYKSLSVKFAAAGEALKNYRPGVKYSCVVGDVVLTEGFVAYGNAPVDGKLSLDIMMAELDDYLRSTGSDEPSACELDLRLEENGPPVPGRKQQPLGKLCYRKVDGTRALAEGACPADVVPRTPQAGRTLTAKVVSARPPRDGSNGPIFGSLLTLHGPLPAAGFSVTLAATCDSRPGQMTLGRGHFDALERGESIWRTGTLQTPGAAAGEAKQCDITIRMKEGETSTELARHCHRGGSLTDGACE